MRDELDKAFNKDKIDQSRLQQLKNYQYILKSAIHPDTDQVIPWIMRASSYIPTNLPIAVAFILIRPTNANIILF